MAPVPDSLPENDDTPAAQSRSQRTGCVAFLVLALVIAGGVWLIRGGAWTPWLRILLVAALLGLRFLLWKATREQAPEKADSVLPTSDAGLPTQIASDEGHLIELGRGAWQQRHYISAVRHFDQALAEDTNGRAIHFLR